MVAPLESSLLGGRYRMERSIAAGGMAEVWLAHDTQLDRQVAVKVLKDHSQQDEVVVERFRREAKALALLNHPNIVPVYDIVEHESRLYVVMRYVRGKSLRQVLDEQRRRLGGVGTISVQMTVHIGRSIALALKHAHDANIVHRDVKPANLLAVLDGDRIIDVKITDFGSAFNSAAEHTQVHRVGSLAYMSPEQLDGDPLDCRADIYSLAAVLYHLVAGRPPFDAQQQQAIMHQIFHATPPPLAMLRENVPPRMVALIERSLAKDRDRRPRDWDEFASELSQLATDRALSRGQLQQVLDTERFTLLRSLEFFADFGDVELWEVVHRARWERHAFGTALHRKGSQGNSFHIIATGQVEVFRDGTKAATLGAGTSVGEMAYLAPNPELRVHTVDVLVSQPATTIAFTPESLDQLSLTTRHRFDKAFIKVLVRRLHAAHESIAHPRRIL